MTKSSKNEIIACSIFKKEIECLIKKGSIKGLFNFVSSDLHMDPQKLEVTLESLIKPGCLLCYGDCHSSIVNQLELNLINKVYGLNCIEIFLGRETYRKLRTEKAFFLLPEWTMKWEHIFKEMLGFSDANVASMFMNEMHKKIIYLNTGVTEIPYQTLDDIAKHFSIPLEILDIDLVHLENAINDGLKHLKK
jgi:hypothetical protein